jgi:perosamine synthetase
MFIPFNNDLRNKYFTILNNVFDSGFWSNGKVLQEFEEKFSSYISIGSRAVSNGGVALLSILDYIDVREKEVIVPSNTFWATILATKKAGAKVVYADSNKEDLCLSFEDFKRRVTTNTKAVIVVHIGGHIAFEIEKIADYCKRNNIYLIEDCAHAHGATFHGKFAGSWGIAGAYSFYATKTMTTGEGGMIVSNNSDFLNWVEEYRNYGKKIVDKKVTYPVLDGFNYRMNEITAALGIIQLESLPEILEWKNNLALKYDQIFSNRIKFPEGMNSGYYKYIVFNYNLSESSGKVYERSDLGHIIDGLNLNLPNTDWITENHHCVPIFHGWQHAEKSSVELERYLIRE